MLTKLEPLALSEQEARALANSLADVLDHHGINITSGTGSVHLTLIMTAVAIYGPRAPALVGALKQRGAKKKPVAAATPQQQLAAEMSGAGSLDLSALNGFNS